MCLCAYACAHRGSCSDGGMSVRIREPGQQPLCVFLCMLSWLNSCSTETNYNEARLVGRGECNVFVLVHRRCSPFPSPGPFYPRSSVHPPKPPSSHAPWNSDEDRNPRLCRASNAKSCFFKREKHRLSFERLRRRHRHAAGMRGINEGRAMFALV